jgi:hypothetical protein
MIAATPICTMPNGSACSAGSPSPRAAASVQNRTPVAQIARRPAQFQRGGFMSERIVARPSWASYPGTVNGRIGR